MIAARIIGTFFVTMGVLLMLIGGFLIPIHPTRKEVDGVIKYVCWSGNAYGTCSKDPPTCGGCEGGCDVVRDVDENGNPVGERYCICKV
jgi:hypothetical protein